MGKTDAKQQCLTFEAKRQAHQTAPPADQLSSREEDRGETSLPEEGLKSILFEMCSGVTTIDYKLDSLTRSMGDMKGLIDKLKMHLTDAEKFISDVEDVQTQQAKAIEEMKVELHKVQLKNDDLEGSVAIIALYWKSLKVVNPGGYIAKVQRILKAIRGRLAQLEQELRTLELRYKDSGERSLLEPTGTLLLEFQDEANREVKFLSKYTLAKKYGAHTCHVAKTLGYC
ncbi:hypothetical protein NDU88_006180 [Pleurodeles waltl]|uniref:Uncharacterized protein n=1 Tax=Pleurodeles waltl TaxID=8319 RepID=A0AAV7LNK2_PLEWA|nr:hypothetical protein NDU88_006180 [Pleurodeles waltl]